MIIQVTRALIKLLRENIDTNVLLSAGDITGITKIPCIVLTGPNLTEKKRLMHDPSRVTYIDRENNIAVREVPPRYYDLRFNVNISADNNLQLLNFFESFSRLNQKYITLLENYVWMWRNIGKISTIPNISQVYQSIGEIIIYDVDVRSEIEEISPLIQKVKINLCDDNLVI